MDALVVRPTRPHRLADDVITGLSAAYEHASKEKFG